LQTVEQSSGGKVVSMVKMQSVLEVAAMFFMLHNIYFSGNCKSAVNAKINYI